jgi:DNA-binding response OmpR family regulator
MERQMKIESIARHPRAQPAPAAQPAEGHVVYIGRQFPRWAEIKRSLAGRNLDVVDSGDPHELLASAALAQYDLIVVGESDARREPHELCVEIRQLGYRGPMLLLTSPGDPIGRILGLENGADAWVATDGDARSCVAQIRALLRRPAAQTAAIPNTLRVGTLVLNAGSREVAAGHRRIDLSTLEFNLLWLLAQHAGEIMPREELAERMGYKIDLPENRTIDTAVSRLRHRLGEGHARQIRTIRSVGYMLCADSLFESAERVPPLVN